MNDAVAAVLAGADQVSDWQEDLYKDLHSHPELSHQEHRTAGKAADRLKTAGFEVISGVGGTGVVGVLRNGDGPSVLLRADMDALPLTEDTGLSYTSTNDGVAHACGHDMHVTCLLGAAQLMADSQKHWSGTLVALFQPAEETINGAAGMVSDGLATRIPKMDIALGQHVTPLPAGYLAATAGPAFAAADSIKITLYGRGGHASMPQTTVDPVVLAAAVVMRLQTIVAREIDPADTAVLTVGSILAGTKANIIPDTAEIQINIRSYSEATRTALLDAIRRIVTAECQASNCPREPDIEYFEHAPLTDNDADVTEKVTGAFTAHFGEAVMVPAPKVMGSEDFSDIANGVGAPYCYWLFGGSDPAAFATAYAAGKVATDIPSNHSPRFAPVIQPTLNTGTAALVAAAMAWLGKDARPTLPPVGPADLRADLDAIIEPGL